MGRALTQRHSLLFRKKVGNPFLFVRDIYQYGKLRELFSFLVWEVCHKFRLFPKRKYLTFNQDEPLHLKSESLVGLEFNEKISQLFSSHGLRLASSEQQWKLLFINASVQGDEYSTSDDGELFGSLAADDRALYQSTDNGKSIRLLKRFPEKIKSIFLSRRNALFVCVKGAVYKRVKQDNELNPDRTSANGCEFKEVLELGSSESFFRYNNAMTETPDGTLVIAEYGNVWEKHGWRKLAYLYFSSDEGETWQRSDFLIKKGTNKHVHLVKYSRLFNKLFMADGDNYKKLWVCQGATASDWQNPERWQAVNHFHIQMGGYTSVIETDKKLLFGTDYQGGTNFIVETSDGRTFTNRVVPDPYRRSPIDNMVQRRSKNGYEIWANLPYSTANSKCLLMYSADGGASWNRVIEYSLATHKVWLISSAPESAAELYFSIEDLRNNDRVIYKVTDEHD